MIAFVYKKRLRVYSLISLHPKPLKMSFSQNFEQSNWACCVHVDEVSSSDYKRLFSLLEAIYAEAVAREVDKLTKERCCGCEYDHPSQRQLIVSCYQNKRDGNRHRHR